MGHKSWSSRRSLARAVWLLGFLLPCAGRAAPGRPAPLQLLPGDRVGALAPLLRSSDMALIESGAQGELRQITTLTLVAAPPRVVREVVIHPEHYGEFVRNMTKSVVQRRPDGTLDHTYQFSYSLLNVEGIHRYVFLPPVAGDAPAPVEMFDSDPGSNGLRHYRWEFLPAGGGTIVVLYGYTDVRHSGGIVDELLLRVPSLEHGLALVSQIGVLLAIKARAQQIAGPAGPLPPAGGASYDFLVDRGLLALLRTRGGRLSDISLVDQSHARPENLLRVASQAALWSRFVPSITRSLEADVGPGLSGVELELSLPLLSWRTVYGVQASSTSVDLVGLSGDLRGGRMRWDVRGARGGQSQLVLRTSQAFDRSSIIIRQLYRLEPLFEYGVNVGLGMVIERGVKNRAEQMTAGLTEGSAQAQGDAR